MANETDVGITRKDPKNLRKEMSAIHRSAEIAHVSREDPVEFVQQVLAAEVRCQVALNRLTDIRTNFVRQHGPHFFDVWFDRTYYRYLVCPSGKGQFGIQTVAELQIL